MARIRERYPNRIFSSSFEGLVVGMRARGAEAEAKWRGLISEQEQSGKTVAEFCRERGIAASKLYSWKRRCLGDKATAGFVRLRAAPAAKTELVATAAARD